MRALIAAKALALRVLGWLFIAAVMLVLFCVLGPAFALGFVAKGIASAFAQGWEAWGKFERSLK